MAEAEPELPELYHACMANDLARVASLLAAGANPNDGESVYHAAQENRRDCLELLLAHGADLSGRDATHRNTPLFFLAGHREGDRQAETAFQGIKWLLEHGADPDVTSYDSEEAPLHAVAKHGWVALAELLVAHGADVHQKRADGKTPLALAVRSGSVALAEYFRTQGAATDDVEPDDEFLGACARGDEADAAALLAMHPDLIVKLGSDARGALVQAVYDRSEAAIRLMTKLGFDLGWEGSWGGTPLHHAAWLGNASLVLLLIGLGAPIDARDSQFGSSALGWAAHGSAHSEAKQADYPAVVNALIDAGAARLPSINKWSEPPERMASAEVAAVFQARGHAP